MINAYLCVLLIGLLQTIQRKNNIYYLIYNNSDGNPSFDDENNEYRNNMNVFHSYKSQLKAYSKKRFDPFCRRDRILFKMDSMHSVETTIGQLNFLSGQFQI